MDKQDFIDNLKNQYTRVGRTQKVNEESGIITYDTLVFEVLPGGARWKTVSWYVLDEDSAHESAYGRQEETGQTDLEKRIDKAIQAKKDAGKWWTAKVENLDEEERFADVRVSVASSTAGQVEERLMRLKEDPADPDQIVCSRVVNKVKSELIKKVFGSTDTVDTKTV